MLFLYQGSDGVMHLEHEFTGAALASSDADAATTTTITAVNA